MDELFYSTKIRGESGKVGTNRGRMVGKPPENWRERWQENRGRSLGNGGKEKARKPGERLAGGRREGGEELRMRH